MRASRSLLQTQAALTRRADADDADEHLVVDDRHVRMRCSVISP
jgi:hypothetical protein